MELRRLVFAVKSQLVLFLYPIPRAPVSAKKKIHIQKVQIQRLGGVDKETKDTKSKEDYSVHCCVTPDKLTTGFNTKICLREYLILKNFFVTSKYMLSNITTTKFCKCNKLYFTTKNYKFYYKFHYKIISWRKFLSETD